MRQLHAHTVTTLFMKYINIYTTERKNYFRLSLVLAGLEIKSLLDRFAFITKDLYCNCLQRIYIVMRKEHF